MRRLVLIGFLVVLLPVASYLTSLAIEIEDQSKVDEAQRMPTSADVIVVLGAAEYNGRPSPVLRARLDHAIDLHRRRLAPRIFTTGGAGGDARFTEGEVARDYLVRQGVPSEMIIVEEQGDSTVHSIIIVSEVMKRMNLVSAILVSDGYHIFRAKRILEDRGVTVYGSPRPEAPKSLWEEKWLYFRQAGAYLLWRIGVNI